MKKMLLRASLALCFGSPVAPVFALPTHVPYLESPSDPLASQATKTLYTYLATRRGASDNKMIEGQHLGGSNQLTLFGELSYDPFYLMNGTLPAMVGTRYDEYDMYDDNGNLLDEADWVYTLDAAHCSALNDELIGIRTDAQFNPPIIHITAVARNPWAPLQGRGPGPNDGSLRDLLHATNLGTDQVKKDTRTRFWQDIDIIAAGLQELEDVGIPVIFRPFAEFNQINKYYWKNQNAADFVALWHDVYNYYTSDNKKGLHNLLFCWEIWVLNCWDESADVAPWYPGTDVDIVAGSYYFNYDKTYVDGSGVFRLPAYDANANIYDKPSHDFLISQNRPFGAAQLGLGQNAPLGHSSRDHDFTRALMTFCPDMAFAYYWSGHQSVEEQYHYAEFVADPRVSTVNDLPDAIFISNAPTTQDGWILESNSTSGIGGSFNPNDTTSNGKYALRTGDDGGRKQYKSILSFDTSSLPDTAIVDSVTLKIKRAVLSPSPGSMSNMGTLTVEMKTGVFNANMALESADFEAASNPPAPNAAVASGISLPTADGQILSAPLNSNGCAAINRSGKTQFRILLSTANDTDTTADFLGWYSGEVEIDKEPVLEINYH